ncbi:MAG: hypothetical protein ACREER_02560 [Alphaproteobacteria bacterium]
MTRLAGPLRDSDGPAAVSDLTRFARLGGGRRVWAVAAIHGEADRLQRLHVTLAARLEPGDRVVYLGNYLGWGPDIRGTLDELVRYRRALMSRRDAFACDVAFLRGAQEEMWHKLLQLQLALEPGRVLAWMIKRGVDATIRAYGADPENGLGCTRGGVVALTRWTGTLREAMRRNPGHYELLHGLKQAAFTEAGGILFVHCGLDPNRPLTAQGDALWWGSSGFAAIAEPYAGFRRVVRGYDPRRGGVSETGVSETGVTVTIDGGSGFGGPLVAVCLDPRSGMVDRIEA